jgi:hypothetical protein
VGPCGAWLQFSAYFSILRPGVCFSFTANHSTNYQGHFLSLGQSLLEFPYLSLRQFGPCGWSYIPPTLSRPPAASKLSPCSFRLPSCRLFDISPNQGFFYYLSFLQISLNILSSWYCRNTTACIYDITTAWYCRNTRNTTEIYYNILEDKAALTIVYHYLVFVLYFILGLLALIKE